MDKSPLSFGHMSVWEQTLWPDNKQVVTSLAVEWTVKGIQPHYNVFTIDNTALYCTHNAGMTLFVIILNSVDGTTE